MILDICAFGKYFAMYNFIKRWRGNYSINTVAVLVYPCFPITFVLVLYNATSSFYIHKLSVRSDEPIIARSLICPPSS